VRPSPSAALATLFGAEWRNPRHPDAWQIVLVAIALGLQVSLLSQPLDWFVSMISADDFFYYIGTAENIASGHGSSMDGGLTQHNGYHPLFLWLMVPGFMVGIDKVAMVPVALMILAVAWSVAIMMAYRIGRRLGGQWGALVAPAVMALNIELLRRSLSGFETSLVTMFLLATVLAVMERRSALVIGVLLGLASLARLDSVIMAVPIAAFMIGQRRWRDLVVAGAVSAVVVSPWVVWSWANFGTPLPLSGVLKSLHGRPEDYWQGLVVFARDSTYRLLGLAWRDLLPPELALAAGTLVVASVVRRVRATWWLLLYALGAPVFFAVMTGSRYEVQFIRYCTPALCLLAILFFARPYRRDWLVLVLMVISLTLASRGYLLWALRSPPRDSFVGLCMREVPGVLDAIAGPDDLVACFDSGAASYFARRPVVNLDGLVNAEVVALLQEEGGGSWTTRYREYFRRKGITIIIGGTRFSWVNIFPDLDQWPVLHEPLPIAGGGEIVFLGVPAPADPDPAN
jgi:hypothetical protein